MFAFFSFIASVPGRIVRIVAGLGLVALGIWGMGRSVGRWVLIGVGLVPLLAGVFDVCVFAPLFSLPFVGEQLRHKVGAS